MEPNIIMSDDGKWPKNSKIFKSPGTKLLLVIVVLFVVIYFLMLLNKTGQPTASNNFSSQNVQITQINLAQLLSDKTNPPSWFPANLPVELNNITAQNESYYPEHKTTLYSLTYNSALKMEQIYSVYGSYFKSNGFTISEQSKNTHQMSYNTSKGNENISINIFPLAESGGATVHIDIIQSQ